MTMCFFTFCFFNNSLIAPPFLKYCFAECNFSIDKVKFWVGFGLVFIECDGNPTLLKNLLLSQFEPLYLFFVTYCLEP